MAMTPTPRAGRMQRFAAFMREYARSPVATVALIVSILAFLLATLAPWITPQDPYDLARLSIMDGTLPPGARSMDGILFILGSDDQGRDILSAIIHGLRISLWVAVSSALLACIVGTALGLISAYVGGRTDALLMRIVDLSLSFPAILVALMLLAIMGKGVGNVILGLLIVMWAYFARAARASALSELKRDYIEAARSLALPAWRVILRHLLPNALPPILVILTIQFAAAMSLEATLSFLGAGVPLTRPSLGLLISNGYQYLLSGRYWMSLFPGITLMVTVLALNLVGDRLRDLLNPRLKR